MASCLLKRSGSGGVAPDSRRNLAAVGGIRGGLPVPRLFAPGCAALRLITGTPQFGRAAHGDRGAHLAAPPDQAFRGARSHLDLQINLLTEQKVTKLIHLLEELRRDLPMVRDREDPHAAALEKRTDAAQVLSALKDTGLTQEVRPGKVPKE